MKCISLLRCLHQVEVIDKSHCSLEDVPNLQNYSRSLEELFLGANKLTTLTRPLFRLTRLRRLNVGDNIIQDIPPDIANLVHLVELDCSRNKIQHIPEQIKFLRSLQICDFSANNIEELPAGLVQLKNLTTLNLNYCLLTKLPDDFGSLKNLQSLELRENELKALPRSFTSLENLRKLDLGQNLIRELPYDIGKLRNLEYLLVDMNNLQTLPEEIGLLENLQLLDVVKQERATIQDAPKDRTQNGDNVQTICEYRGLSHLPEEISGLECLTNLHLSDNTLDYLPDGIGQLKNLVTLKVDKNNLTELNSTIGGCVALQELVLTSNELRELPSTIGLLSDLRTLNVDENKLSELTPQIGSLKKLGILSLRDNKLVHLPSEIGNLRDLRVLDLADNILEYLPCSFTNLNLSALWLSTNQAQPLLKLQTDELFSGAKVLTCYLLPQINDKKENLHTDDNPSHGLDSDDDYENTRPAAVKFDNEAIEDNEFNSDVQFVRHDTPHPKELKARHQRLFVKDKVETQNGSEYSEDVKQVENGTGRFQNQDNKHKDSTVHFPSKDSVDRQQSIGTDLGYHANGLPDIPLTRQNKSLSSLRNSQPPYEDREEHETNENRTVLFDQPKQEIENQPRGKLHRRDTPHHLKNQQVNALSKEDKRKVELLAKDKKRIIYIDVYRTDPGIGLSIAGGKGTPPFKDDDEGIFVSKVTPKGPTEAAGVKVKDKILAVNDKEFYEGIDHATAVEIFKKVKSNCNKFTLKVLRDEADEDETQTKDEAYIQPTDNLNNSTTTKKQNPLEDTSSNTNTFVRSYSIPDAPTGNRAINNLRQSLMTTTKNTNATPTNLRASCRDGRSESVTASLARGLSLADNSSNKHIIFTTLVRDKQGCLGLGIEGGADSDDCKPGTSNVTITSIKPDSVAARDGKLQPNDRIITINGTDVAPLDHERVVALLNSSDRFVRIVVARGESDDPIDAALRSMPARPPLESWGYSSSSYMAHRPSFTGSYRRPTFGSVSSLASGDVSLNIHNMTNSSAAIPGMVTTSQARSNSVHKRLQGLRSHEPTFLPRPKPTNSSATVDIQQQNGKSKTLILP